VELYRYLTRAEVLQIHDEMVRRYGGTLQIWDWAKLDSAIEAPKAGFGGFRVHNTIEEIAAGYWFHISQNHPFESANKRTGTEASLVFLRLNGYRITCKHSELKKKAIDVASGKIKEADLALWIKQNIERM
jgi:death-on-curing protein